MKSVLFHFQWIFYFIFRIKMENHYCQSMKKNPRSGNDSSKNQKTKLSCDMSMSGWVVIIWTEFPCGDSNANLVLKKGELVMVTLGSYLWFLYTYSNDNSPHEWWLECCGFLGDIRWTLGAEVRMVQVWPHDISYSNDSTLPSLKLGSSHIVAS